MAKQKQTTCKPTTVPVLLSSWRERYELLNGRDEYGATDAVLDKVAEELMEFAAQPTSMSIAPFLDERFIPKQTWLDWKKRHAGLAKAEEFARSIMGRRLREFGLKVSPERIWGIMHLYDRDYADAHELEKASKIEVSSAVAQAKAEAEKGNDGPIHCTVTFPDDKVS